MKNLKFIIIASFVIVPCLIGKAQVTNNSAKSAETELLAQKIVSQCANIKEGEFVLIQGGIRTPLNLH
ncbi:MAG: hypothetical protein MUE37_03455 [Bacteroidales bacterium]|jgi:hypothetical protein|nr:hypothetical protein [Bacteroidales bacterium]